MVGDSRKSDCDGAVGRTANAFSRAADGAARGESGNRGAGIEDRRGNDGMGIVG